MYTIQKNVSNKVRGEVKKVDAMVENGLHETIVSAMKSLSVPKTELAMRMRSISTFLVHSPSSVLIDLD